MTACSNSVTFSNAIASFPNILTNTGINDINSLKTTGKFVCEFPGLYFISSYIRTRQDDRSFYLKKNGQIISNGATTDWPSSAGRSTTIISAAVDCQKNDELYLYNPGRFPIDSSYSCFNVIKIK